ncbi:MAG TPA: DAK2 domain-containing protein, partial [Thermomicrobiaceae bacterium]|nr:DAK2 domain-containing protein [Thermomicrobiaceae bacterium]
AFIRRFRAAAHAAGNAVARPRQGTILTVMEAAANALPAAEMPGLTIVDMLDRAAKAALEALMRTTGQLSVLEEAGVVDAGGYGFVVLVEALRGFAQQRAGTVPYPISIIPCPRVDPLGDALNEAHDAGSPSYCINFVLSGRECVADTLRDRLTMFGESLVVVEAVGRFRVHLHSPRVADIIAEAGAMGAVSRLRVEEITEHATHGGEAHRACRDQTLIAAPDSDRNSQPILVIACASGHGLERVMRAMGATTVVRSDLPDFEETLRSAMAKLEVSGNLIALLPNDATLIAPLRALVDERESVTEDVTLKLIETSSIPQGLAALAARRPFGEATHRIELMRAASLSVRTFIVVNTLHTIDREEPEAGPRYLGRIDGQDATWGDDPAAVLIEMLTSAQPEDYELLTIFSGVGIEPTLLERVQQTLGPRFPWLDLEMIDGGQSRETFIAALE